MTFKRENRYVVVKWSRLTPPQFEALSKAMLEQQIDMIECVVVERDWPEYEPTWAMIESRAALDAPPTQSDEVARLRAHIADHIKFAEDRIVDGKELGSAVWRLALEDIVSESRAALETDGE